MTRRLLGAAVSVALLGGCVVTTAGGPSAPPVTGAVPYEPSEPTTDIESEPAAGPEATASDKPEKIGARHLLVQYRGALRAPADITRSKAEAQQRAQEALDRIEKGEDFAIIAAEYSDEPGAASRGGSIGRFSRDDMVPEFSAAAFALEAGEVSAVVETPFGFHVIQRTE